MSSRRGDAAPTAWRRIEQLEAEKWPFPSPSCVHLPHSTDKHFTLFMFCFAPSRLILVQNADRMPGWGILVEKKRLVPINVFFPSLRIGRAEPIAYTVKNYSIFANTNMRSEFPLSQHIRQPPTTWQLPSAARQLLSQRSEDFLMYCSLPIKGSRSIRPADHIPWRGVWRILRYSLPLLPYPFHFGTSSPHISRHGFWVLGFTTRCHMLQGGCFPGSHSMHIRSNCSRRKQVPPSLQESRGWNH